MMCRFPELHDRIQAAMRRFIAAAGERAKATLVSLFECEMAYVNTDHPEYIGMQRAWKEYMSEKEGGAGSDAESPDGRAHDRARHHSHSSQALTIPPRAGHHVRALPLVCRVYGVLHILCVCIPQRLAKQSTCGGVGDSRTCAVLSDTEIFALTTEMTN